MTLPRISIRRPVLASMMSLALVLFGLISLQRLPVRELPDIDPPIVSVTTVYPGASAEVVETEVTERLEEEINNISGIKTITSKSREEVSSISIQFELSRNIDQAAQDVRDRIARVRGRLPDTVKEPVVTKHDADAHPVIWIGLSSDRYTPLELTTLAEKQIKNRLQTVGGVSSVIIGGEQRFAIRLWLDAAKMAAHQVTVLDVEKALQQQNVELPSGRIENLNREMTIETQGELKTAAQFNRLVIKDDGIKMVRLRDIGIAEQGVENERSAARNNGKPCIFLGIVKQSKANTVAVADGVRAAVRRIRRSLPAGVNMTFNVDESLFIKQSISEVWVTLGIAFALVAVVIYLFLGDVRSTLIPVVTIPVSLVGAFLVLYAMGYSVNILTMLALVLAIGIVVDDAIVVLENIYRHIEQGVRPMAAAFQAMDEIGFAIIAITLSLVAVFLPLTFQTSTTGRLFIEFAFAVVGAVVISAFVALSLTPMMASRILRPHTGAPHSRLVALFDRFYQRVTDGYRGLLGWALSHRWTVVAAGLASLFLAVLAYSSLEKEFMPEEDKGRLICFVITPEGSTPEYTDRMLRQVEAILSQVPEIKIYGAIVAPGFSGPGVANNGIAFVHLKEKRKRSLQEIVEGPDGLRAQFAANIKGALAVAEMPKAIGHGFGSPFRLVIQCQDLKVLDAYTRRLMDLLRATGHLQNIRSSFEFNKPELHLRIDRDRAAALGVSLDDLSRTLQILFGGLDLSTIKLGGKEYKVMAQLQRSSRLTPSDMDKIYVRSRGGRLIQLNSLVWRQTRPAPNAIEHYDRLRSTTIQATPVGLPLGTAMQQADRILSTNLPPGFSYEWAGESRDLREAGQEIWWVLGLALVIVYMVLASQFESLIHPLTVILAVPLAGVGAFGLLWVLNVGGRMGWIPKLQAMDINLFSQIGLILLVGLVTKNSILLVEFANQRKGQGMAAREAMLDAGAVRLRPILMTTLSTIAGILPIAIGFGAGSESRRPMGVAVIGGMATSTFLTLIVIPVVYTLFDDLAQRVKHKVRQPIHGLDASSESPLSPGVVSRK